MKEKPRKEGDLRKPIHSGIEKRPEARGLSRGSGQSSIYEIKPSRKEEESAARPQDPPCGAKSGKARRSKPQDRGRKRIVAAEGESRLYEEPDERMKSLSELEIPEESYRFPLAISS